MLKTDDILYIYDASGNLAGVQLSIELWKKLEPYAVLTGNEKTAEPECEDDMPAFEALLNAWDFPYPYDPAVTCPQCQASTADWRLDEPRQFRLANANIGGLLVFHCKNCGAIIRHKYFKDHMAREFTAKNS